VEINLDQTNGLDAELTVKIGPDDYQHDFDKEIKNYQKKVDLPGFRKGKAPVGLLKKRIGTDLKKQLVPDTVNKALQDYIREHDLKLLLNPLEKTPQKEPDWENQDSFEFTYDVGLRPEMDLDLQQWLGDVVQYKIEATDEEIEEQVRKIQNLKGSSETREKVTDEDTLSLRLNIVELDDNQEAMEGGFYTNKTLTLAELPDQFKNELLDRQSEEKFVIDIKSCFADFVDDQNEKLAAFLDTDKLTVQDLGNQFEVTIESVYTFHPAELNENIFQAVFPDKEINDADEFRAAIREALASSYERESDSYLFKEVKDAIVKQYDKGLPEQFLHKWFDKVQQEEEEQEKQNEQQDERSHEEKYKEFVNDIKWMIIIDGLADRFEVSVEGQEVMEYAQSMIRNEVQRIGMGEIGEDQVKEYASNYLKDQNNYFKAHFTIKEDKVFRQIKENVDFQEKPISYNEFQQIVNPPESESQTEANDQETEKTADNE